jgi:hypothetical protein
MCRPHTTVPPEMGAMRRQAWRARRVASLPVEGIADFWPRAVTANEAVRRRGRRHGGAQHGG